MISYKITSYDLKGSIKPQGPKGRVQDIELPEDAVPIGFDTVIKDATTKGELFDWAFYPTVKVLESWQREWLDKEHTEFVCVIDGVLKRYQVITRVYCMQKIGTEEVVAGRGIKLNPESYIGTNIKEGTTEVTMHIQYSEMPFSNLHDLQAKPQKHKYLSVMWEDGEHHEVRFPIYLLEAQCQK